MSIRLHGFPLHQALPGAIRIHPSTSGFLACVVIAAGKRSSSSVTILTRVGSLAAMYMASQPIIPSTIFCLCRAAGPRTVPRRSNSGNSIMVVASVGRTIRPWRRPRRSGRSSLSQKASRLGRPDCSVQPPYRRMSSSRISGNPETNTRTTSSTSTCAARCRSARDFLARSRKLSQSMRASPCMLVCLRGACLL